MQTSDIQFGDRLPARYTLHFTFTKPAKLMSNIRSELGLGLALDGQEGVRVFHMPYISL